jgi:PhnB protein
MSSVKAIPPGFHSITPSLTCKDAARAIEFYKKIFGAQERMRKSTPDGTQITHAELTIGDSILFVNDELGPQAASAPGPQKISLFLYVEDADTTFKRAVEAGSKVMMPLENQFWGDRFGSIVDPFGHSWGIATHVEDLTPEEVDRRAAAFFAKVAGKN